MIESLMLIGIGICAGCLLVLVFVPLVHRRSARLTTRYLVETGNKTHCWRIIAGVQSLTKLAQRAKAVG
jgi:hypothetical protein